jgi:hypothetical protein
MGGMYQTARKKPWVSPTQASGRKKRERPELHRTEGRSEKSGRPFSFCVVQIAVRSGMESDENCCCKCGNEVAAKSMNREFSKPAR